MDSFGASILFFPSFRGFLQSTAAGARRALVGGLLLAAFPAASSAQTTTESRPVRSRGWWPSNCTTSGDSGDYSGFGGSVYSDPHQGSAVESATVADQMIEVGATVALGGISPNTM